MQLLGTESTKHFKIVLLGVHLIFNLVFYWQNINVLFQISNSRFQTLIRNLDFFFIICCHFQNLCTVCWVRFKKNFKYFHWDPHRIVSYGLKVENKHSLKSWIEGQICKSILSKVTSTKTNKNKKWTPLLKTNFLRYTTLLLVPKRFVLSKGPKIALCLCETWLSLDIERRMCNIPYPGWAMFNRDKVQF